MRPLSNYVLIEPNESPDTTPSGLVLPESSKDKPNMGTVEATGTGMYNDHGEPIPMSVTPGDVVLFPKYAGTELKINGKKFLIMRESEIFGIV